LFVPVIARFSEKARNYFAVIISLVTAVLAFSLLPELFFGAEEALGSSTAWISSEITAGVFIDPLSVLFTVLVAFFGLIIAIYSLGYMKGEEGLTRYYFLLLLFIGSMIGLVISDNFLQMFVFWEMVGLCSYALISFWNNTCAYPNRNSFSNVGRRHRQVGAASASHLVIQRHGGTDFRKCVTTRGNYGEGRHLPDCTVNSDSWSLGFFSSHVAAYGSVDRRFNRVHGCNIGFIHA
jgi:NADH-quinone oxidoreductase subunit L